MHDMHFSEIYTQIVALLSTKVYPTKSMNDFF